MIATQRRCHKKLQPVPTFSKIWNLFIISITFAIGNKTEEGNEIVPFSFYHMATDTIIQELERLTDEVLTPEPEYFRVNVKIKPTNNVKVFIDGDKGVSIEKCVQFNRKLYKILEEKALFPDGDFSLEVSSPGVDEPLKMHRQYNKNIGRFVEVIFPDGSKQEGKLLQVAEADIIIEQATGKGKKAITQQLVIPFNNIKTTTVQIKF